MFLDIPGWLLLPGLLIWLSVLLLPWQAWRNREQLDADPSLTFASDRVTVLIPARDEAGTIATTLRALKAQHERLRVILIDDQSSDGTADLARAAGLPGLRIINGQPLPGGWSGKLWALEQGLGQVDTPLVLLLDADIELLPGILAALIDRLEQDEQDLVSLMARLRMKSPWERLLMPAFIYFFKLLYPFALSNSGNRLIAAAAGGCILVKTARLRELGGFAAYREALIDDCALARQVKESGGRTWIGLSHAAVSLRPYDDLRSIWQMVARTAYTQLHYSSGLLLLCTVLMAAAFPLPVAGLFAAAPGVRLIAGLSLLVMAGSYLPTLHYYRLRPWWCLGLPLTGLLYLLMTWSSALRYWRGEQSNWKGRSYQRDS